MELYFYKLPFYVDDYIGWVYDADDNFMFQIKSGPKSTIVERLNKVERVPNKASLTIDAENSGMILNYGDPFILIRGWGNLTGTGGHNLPAEEAVKIQDNLRDWIMWKLELKE
jgi:hypothetical protein